MNKQYTEAELRAEFLDRFIADYPGGVTDHEEHMISCAAICCARFLGAIKEQGK